jgi:hypothetical protein
MKRSTLLKVATALGVAAGLAAPVSAQVSQDLRTSAFGPSGAAASGFSALSNVGGTRVEGATIDANGVSTGGTTVITTGGGGKVGTFQASLSEGDQQRFAVGTSTNISVNASSSSTSDYQTNSTATFGVGSSNLRQTIGTSGVSETATSRANAASSYAATAVETEVGNSAERYYEKASASGNTASSNSNWAWWNNSYSGRSWNQLSSSEQQSITSSYNQVASSINQRATSEYNSSASASEASNGVISGSFVSNSASTTSPTTAEANNQVTVKGIGNAASVNAQSNSVFSSVITGRANFTPSAGSSGTASGSAGANVSSTASADAAATKFSSVFIQAY